MKKLKYPNGRVINVKRNSLNEVVEANLKKGNGEIGTYHVSSLIPILRENH
jgi:hypothetical protein